MSQESYSAYKPSGIPWLGGVPGHWSVGAVKQNYEIQLGKMLQPSRQALNDTEVPYLKAVNVQWFKVRTSDPLMMWASPVDAEQYGIESGDLLVCEGGEGGRCGIVRSSVNGYIIQNALHRVRSREHSLNEYLQFVLYVAAARGYFEVLNDKTTIAHFTKEKLTAFRIPLPPLPNSTPSSATWTTPTVASDATSAPSESSSRCWRRRSKPSSTEPSPAASTPMSVSSPPASSGSAMCRSIGRFHVCGI